MAKKTTTAIVADPELTQLSGEHYVDWPAITGGAVLAAAISIVLVQFGGAIGLSADGLGTERGIGAGLLALATGIWIVWTACVSAMAGGYVAGRARPRIGDATEDEIEFRDGMHGLLVWGLATLIAAAGLGFAALASGIAATAAASAPDVAAGTAPEAEAALADFARRSGVVFGFATAAGAAVSAAVAWYAATIGGEHRDQGVNVYGFVPAFLKRPAA
jgi:hypothetical protein